MSDSQKALHEEEERTGFAWKPVSAAGEQINTMLKAVHYFVAFKKREHLQFRPPKTLQPPNSYLCLQRNILGALLKTHQICWIHSQFLPPKLPSMMVLPWGAPARQTSSSTRRKQFYEWRTDNPVAVSAICTLPLFIANNLTRWIPRRRLNQKGTEAHRWQYIVFSPTNAKAKLYIKMCKST